jgi:flagellar hook-associated protein 1 FlgK
MAASSGKLVALASVRDDTAVTYQSQLDEIARGLIDAFKETDQSGSALPDMPGLFTWPGAPAFPPRGSIQTGLAATISINASVDPAQGGDPSLLRDGAISGNPAYAYNTTGAAGFSDRLQALVDQANATASFDPAAQAGTSVTISQFAASSAAWLEAARKSAGSESEYRSTLLDRSNEALSKISGVNLDEEMTNMLELERSYQASSRVISSINDMFETLLQAVG